LYRSKVENSFVMQDLKKYKDLPEMLHNNPHLLTTYPELINQAAHTMIHVDGITKHTKEREIRRSFIEKRSLFGLMGDAYKVWRATR
jgi:electron transfer flavoprotein-quinone oxidoreductase